MRELINGRYQADLTDDSGDLSAAYARFIRFRGALRQEADRLRGADNYISANAYITDEHNEMPMHIQVVIRSQVENFRSFSATVNYLMNKAAQAAGIHFEDSDTPNAPTEDVYSVDALEFAGS